MSQFLLKNLRFRTHSLVLLQNTNVGSFRLRWFSVSSEDDKKHSFTVSYLINSLGFSPKTALSGSKYLNFETNVKPDQTIEFFNNNGFTKTQISTIVRYFPRVLLSNTEKTILPKLEFLKSKGLSVPEITKFLSTYPNFLRVSLSNQIIPSYDYLRNFTRSDQKIVLSVKRHPYILCNLKRVKSNIDILLQHGVPESKIAQFVERCPLVFIFNSPDRWQRIVEEISEMGFDVSTTKFTWALSVFAGISESTRKRKCEKYKKCGFSEEEISKIFRIYPLTMSISEGKVSARMDFFVNEMNWSPSHITTYPMIIGMSLEKRIIPRCSVFKVLISKGLWKKKVDLRTLLGSSEEKFLEKYIAHYEKEAPELLKSYEEKLGL